MQRMPVIVSPELRNAEPRWLEKAIPRGFSVLIAPEVKTTDRSCLELQIAAGQSARVKIIQLNNRYQFVVLFAKCSSWGKNCQMFGKNITRKKCRVENH